VCAKKGFSMNRGRKLLVGAVAALLGTALFATGTAGAAPVRHVNIPANPPMGWSSWSSLHQGISTSIIEAQAKSLHDNLASVGYQYVNIDAGWQNGVDQYGRPTYDTTKFATGIAPVAKYVHSLGLKFGIYLVPGIPAAAVTANSPILGTKYHIKDIADTTKPGNTAQDGSAAIDYTKPGAMAYVQSEANLLASWGVDYLKMDFVGPGGGKIAADNRADIQAWHNAIQRSGRAIHLELSNSLSFANASTWAQYSNGWRIEGDVECYSHCVGLTNWAMRVSKRFTDVPQWIPFAGPGHWNDLDSLEVGNGTTTDGLSAAEEQSTITLWSIESAPLLLGTNLTKLDPSDLALLKNKEVVAVDQSGHPAHPVSQATQQQVWFAKNRDGSYTVALFNLGSDTATVTANWSDLGLHGAASVRDLWAEKNLGSQASGYSATLGSHASMLLRVTPTR
jgi:hypothetical protein